MKTGEDMSINGWPRAVYWILLAVAFTFTSLAASYFPLQTTLAALGFIGGVFLLKINKIDTAMIYAIVCLALFSLYGTWLITLLIYGYYIALRLVTSKNQPRIHTAAKICLIFFIGWLLYAVIQMEWIVKTENTMKYVKNLVYGVGLVILFSLHVQTFKKLITVYNAWLFSLVLMIGIGWWEVLTGNHLPKSGALQYQMDEVATAAFYNPNDFAFFLIVSLPVLFFSISDKNIGMKAFSWLIMLSSVYFIYLAQARMIYILLIGMIFLYMGYLVFYRKIKIVLSIIAGVFLFCLAFLKQLTDFWQQIISLKGDDGSVEVRRVLTADAWNIAKNNIFGVGAGNIEYYLDQFGTNVGRIVNVHNWWIEILANYGIFVFSGYVLFMVFSLFWIGKSLLHKAPNAHYMYPLFFSLLVFTVSCIESSSVAGMGITWLLPAVTICILNIKKADEDNFEPSVRGGHYVG
ncbi:O-antigen ligase [Paenibacillus sp. UNC499MF]|uniref:O-antigen ligase family protein n=1 Tax=Paenibacillus sp. UNC499MF TaxID=1502751 RepID=UPI002155FB92|nr:O-antigen ligase family protein [Paenibacillus sp. UNC499MF]